MGFHRLINSRTGDVLASKVTRAENAWTRLKGLIGTRPEDFGPGHGLWLCPAKNVHTVGMAFPIDVLYLDSENCVISMQQNLSPFRISRFIWKAHSILELQAGTLAENDVRLGDLLSLEERDGSPKR